MGLEAGFVVAQDDASDVGELALERVEEAQGDGLVLAGQGAERLSIGVRRSPR